MEVSSETEALLAKLRIEQRRIVTEQSRAVRSDAPYPPADDESRARRAQQQQHEAAGGGRASASGFVPDGPPAPTAPSADQQQQGGNGATTLANITTATETELRLELQIMSERVHSLETSLQYERERHAQTRELLRLALKPPPPDTVPTLADHGGGGAGSAHSSPRAFREGVGAVSPGGAAAAMLAGLDGAGGAAYSSSPPRYALADQQIAAANALHEASPASYERFEVYGPATPSRTAQLIYDKAHQLDHPPSASKQVLAQAQANHNLMMNNNQFQHHHDDGGGHGGGGGWALPAGQTMLSALPGHEQHHHHQQQQNHYGVLHPAGLAQHMHHQRGGGTPVRSSTRRGTPSRNRSYNSNALQHQPGQHVPAARPFGVGEKRMQPIAIFGEQVMYQTDKFAINPVTHRVPAAGSGVTSPHQSGRSTPARGLRSRSPVTTLRSPAQNVYNSWA